MIAIGYSNKNTIYSIAPFTDYYKDFKDTFNLMMNGTKVPYIVSNIYNMIIGEDYKNYKINDWNLSTAEYVFLSTNLFEEGFDPNKELDSVNTFMNKINDNVMVRVYVFDKEFTFNKGGEIDKASDHFRVLLDTVDDLKLLSFFIDSHEGNEHYIADVIDAIMVQMISLTNESYTVPIIKIDDCKLCLNIYDCQDITAFIFILNYIRCIDKIHYEITGERIPNITDFVIDISGFEYPKNKEIHNEVMGRIFEELDDKIDESKLVDLYNKFIFL